MADDKFSDSRDESVEPANTDPDTAAEDEKAGTPGELTDSGDIVDARDTPNDDYVDDPATHDINEAKLGRATDEVAQEGPSGAVPARRGSGRTRATAPVRKRNLHGAATGTVASPGSERSTPTQFVGESIGELRKVVWPTGTQLQQYFVVVLVFVLFVMTFVSLLDLGFGWVILKVFGGS